MECADLGVAGNVCEQHAPRERVGLDVGEPGVRHGRDAVGERTRRAHALSQGPQQLVAVDGEQLQVEVLLRCEVAVDDHLRHTCALGHFVERRTLVAALREQLGGGEDQCLAPLGRREPPARSPAPADAVATLGGYVTHE